MLEISSAKIAGNPGDSGWVQIYDFKPDEPEKLKLRGHLFAVIATSQASSGLENVVAGREIISRLHEEYFGKTETTPFNALKLAVEKVIGEFSSQWQEIEIAAIAHLEGVVYSAASGGSQVSILRNQMFAKILVSPIGQTVSASGYPQEGDVVFIGTKKVFTGTDDSQIKSALESLDPKIAAEQVAMLIHSQKEESMLGALIIKFSSQEPSESVVMAPVENQTTQGISWFNKATGGFKGFVNKVSTQIGKKLPQKRIYIKNDVVGDFQATEKKGVTFSVGIILLVLLIVSIIFGVRQKNLKEEKQKYEGRLTQAVENYAQALNLYQAEPSQARSLFIDSENLANTLNTEGVKDTRLNKLLEDLSAQRGPILGEYTQEPVLYMDLTLLSSGFKGDSFALSGKNLYVMDKEAKKIVSVAIDTKKTKVVAGPDSLKNPTSFTAYENRAFAVDGEGISEVGSTATQLIEKTWSGEALVRAYAGNLYLVDKGGSMIWRYVGTADEFGPAQKWLGEGVSPDFSKSSINSLYALSPSPFIPENPIEISFSPVIVQFHPERFEGGAIVIPFDIADAIADASHCLSFSLSVFDFI